MKYASKSSFFDDSFGFIANYSYFLIFFQGFFAQERQARICRVFRAYVSLRKFFG
jgi:nicotinamide riboside transporter PnuC